MPELSLVDKQLIQNIARNQIIREHKRQININGGLIAVKRKRNEAVQDITALLELLEKLIPGSTSITVGGNE